MKISNSKGTLFRQVIVIAPNSPWNGRTVDILIDHHSAQLIKIHDEIPITTEMDVITFDEDVYVSAGWVALAVSLTEPGYELRDTLQNITHGAFKHGFTSCIFYPNSFPVTDTSMMISSISSGKDNSNLPVQIYQVGALSEGCQGKDMTEFSHMIQAGAVAFTDGFSAGSNSGLLLRALDYARLFNRPIIQLPIDASIAGYGVANESPAVTALGLSGIPSLAETVFLAKALHIAAYTEGCGLHISPVTTREGVELVRQAKIKGIKVTADTALPYILFEDSILSDFDTVYKVFPPIRTADDRQAVIEGLKDGTIDCISTHHQPLTVEDKLVEWDYASFGMMTIQGFFPALLKKLVHENAMPLERFIACVTDKARSIFNLPSMTVAPGAKELTFFNLNEEWALTRNELFSKSTNNPFLNQTMKGRVVATLSNGNFQSMV